MNRNQNKCIRSLYTMELILHHLRIFSEVDETMVKIIDNNKYLITNLHHFKKFLRKINPQFKKEINNLFSTLTVFKRLSPLTFKSCKEKNKIKIMFAPDKLFKNPFEKILHIEHNTFFVRIPFHVMICHITLNPTQSIESIISKIDEKDVFLINKPKVDEVLPPFPLDEVLPPVPEAENLHLFPSSPPSVPLPSLDLLNKEVETDGLISFDDLDLNMDDMDLNIDVTMDLNIDDMDLNMDLDLNMDETDIDFGLFADFGTDDLNI